MQEIHLHIPVPDQIASRINNMRRVRFYVTAEIIDPATNQVMTSIVSDHEQEVSFIPPQAGYPFPLCPRQ